MTALPPTPHGENGTVAEGESHRRGLFPRPTHCMLRVVCRIALLIALALTPVAYAQSASDSVRSADLPDSPSEVARKQKENDEQRRPSRLMRILRPYGTVEHEQAGPLTPHQKFHFFARNTVDAVQFGIVGLEAGISQATGQFPEYGQGAQGYGKRYGAGLADSTSSRFFGNFFYPVIFKEDPRYFRSGKGSFTRRLFYAVSRELVAKKDNGGTEFHYSNTLAAITAGAISNAYYPPRDRGFGLTMGRAGISLLIGSAQCVRQEFWPEIQRKLLRRRHKTQSSPAASEHAPRPASLPVR